MWALLTCCHDVTECDDMKRAAGDISKQHVPTQCLCFLRWGTPWEVYIPSRCTAIHTVGTADLLVGSSDLQVCCLI